MNVIYFTGNVGRDAELRSVRDNQVCNFSVAVKQGFGRDAPTEWYRVEMWGKRGESLAGLVKKSAKVAVCGELVIDQYEGKPQYRVRAYEIDPFCGGKADSVPNSRQSKAPTPAELDDDCPF